MHTLKLFFLVLPAFLALDLLWLGVLMEDFYSRELGDLARRHDLALAPRWSAAVFVYLLIPAGIVLFVRPLTGTGAALGHAFGWGALFGLILYGVYDLTNLAVLDKWTLRLTLADIAWGCVLCGTTAVLMCLADGWLAGTRTVN